MSLLTKLRRHTRKYADLPTLACRPETHDDDDRAFDTDLDYLGLLADDAMAVLRFTAPRMAPDRMRELLVLADIAAINSGLLYGPNAQPEVTS